MTRVIADGDRRHRLEDDAGTDIGWIRGRVIGFGGLPGGRLAVEAAFAAYCALGIALGRHYFGFTQRAVRRDRLQVVNDGVHEWLADGDTRLARVLRPSVEAPRERFAIELVLPSFASEGAVIAVAQSLALVVKPFREAEHGVVSGPWQHDEIALPA